MTDLLNMEQINALPRPLTVVPWGSGSWLFPVHDIDVETGMMRIDVCGVLQITHFSDIKYLRDGNGIDHDSDIFYTD